MTVGIRPEVATTPSTIQNVWIFADFKVPLAENDYELIRDAGFSDVVLGAVLNESSLTEGRKQRTIETALFIKNTLGLRVHIMAWIKRVESYITNCSEWMLDVADGVHPTSLMLDAEGDWHSGTPTAQDAAEQVVTELIDPVKAQCPGCVVGVTGIASPLHSKVLPLLRVCDYGLPQAYSIWKPVPSHWSHSMSTEPFRQQQQAWTSWSQDSSGNPIGKPLVMGLGNYWLARPVHSKRHGLSAMKPGDTIYNQYEGAKAVGAIDVAYWSLKWINGKSGEERIAREFTRSISPRRIQFPLSIGGGIDYTSDRVKAWHKHIEKDTQGGYFPMGANSFWHGGVHLHADKGTPVTSPLYGIVEAARLIEDPDEAYKRYGSVNFILISHEISGEELLRMSSSTSIVAHKKYILYALYMHLDNESISESNDAIKNVKWLRDRSTQQIDTTLADQLKTGAVVNVDRPIEQGEMLWTIGNYSVTPGDNRGLVHLEFFSKEKFLSDWQLVEDTDTDYSNDCWAILSNAGQKDFGFKEKMEAGEVENAYKNFNDISALRRYVCRFYNEWAVDPDPDTSLKTVMEIYGRDVTELIAGDIRPYMWWQSAKNAGVSLPTSPHVYHYNPIEFIDVYKSSHYPGMIIGLGSEPGSGTESGVGDGKEEKDAEWACWVRKGTEATTAYAHNGGVIARFGKTDADKEAAKGEAYNNEYWHKANYECWVYKNVPSALVRKAKLWNGSILGCFATEEEALSAREPGSNTPFLKGGLYECVIRSQSYAETVKCIEDYPNGGIIGVFKQEAEAVSEAAAGSPWVKPQYYECWIEKDNYFKRAYVREKGIVGVFELKKDAEAFLQDFPNDEDPWMEV